MLTDLPPELITAIQEGRVVLLLGAGASYGADDRNGHKIPMGKDIASDLVSKFLSSEYADLDFRLAYDLSCSQRDVRTVQRFIHERLEPFHPADYHALIPSFAWAGLLTTNYDLIIERAYHDAGGDALQRLIPHVKDADGATANEDEKSVLYVKLHGCITRSTEVIPPMIASTEQLIAFREGRSGQFNLFLEWSRNRTLVFVGYAFGDQNLRTLLDEIVREGDNRPRHYIVDPLILPAFSDYWRDRRFQTIKLSFEQFLRQADAAISAASRSLTTLSVALSGGTSFSKFITVPNQVESDELTQYLKFGISHIYEGFEPTNSEELSRFYRGFDLEWLPFKHELDVERKVSDAILSEHVITNVSGTAQKLIVLKGHAGSGKTVSLRRACWDAGQTYEKLCFFIPRDGTINVTAFAEIFALSNIPLFLFVDGAAIHQRRILELMALARGKKASITVIASESFNTWNSSCDSLEPLVNAEYEMHPLSIDEIDRLIEKLEKNDSLGTLKAIPRDKRRGQFEVAYARQILVALLETTHGLPLVEIITREYQSIVQPEARSIYLDICSLHRFGPPVRAGLISRMHSITFEEFEEKFFRPLEQIVRLRPDRRSGDYVYEARHPQIAEALYEAILSNQDERFDNLARIISKLNSSYSYDLEVLSKVIKADNIMATIADRSKARQLYDVAFENMGEIVVILHQRGIYELKTASNMAELRKASEYLEKASEKDPRNRSLKHSLAELDLKRSQLSTDDLERATWRRLAIERAVELTTGDSSPYPYHTIIKAYTNEIEDALGAVESSETEANTRQLGEAITSAENSMKRALQKFPDDPSLLAAEGRLAEVLANSVRAESAFKRAFDANPRSVLIARRLVRILRAKTELGEATTILSKALAANPSSAELHYELARVLILSAPNADVENGETILYHLRRSFSIGDRNYRAQFWYARQLCVMDRFEEAIPFFERLDGMQIAFSQKSFTHAEMKDASGTNRRLHGMITLFRSSFGFIRSDSPRMDIFLPLRNLDATASTSFFEGNRVSFEVGFNLKGPVALAVQRLQ
ncbi:P-loop NTPase [Agrobacterium deltaense]